LVPEIFQFQLQLQSKKCCTRILKKFLTFFMLCVRFYFHFKDFFKIRYEFKYQSLSEEYSCFTCVPRKLNFVFDRKYFTFDKKKKIKATWNTSLILVFFEHMTFQPNYFEWQSSIFMRQLKWIMFFLFWIKWIEILFFDELALLPWMLPNKIKSFKNGKKVFPVG